MSKKTSNTAMLSSSTATLSPPETGEMLPEYDFSGGVRGKYIGKLPPRPSRAADTVTVSVSLPPETLAFYTSLGDNPQVHMETVLSEYAALHKDAPITPE